MHSRNKFQSLLIFFLNWSIKFNNTQGPEDFAEHLCIWLVYQLALQTILENIE